MSYNVKKTLNSIWHAKSLQSCRTLCNPIDCSPPDSSVHGILQARIQESIAIPFFRGSSPLRDQTLCLLHLPQWQLGSLPLAPPGKQMLILFLFALRFFFFLIDSLWDGWFFIFGLGEFEEMYTILTFYSFIESNIDTIFMTMNWTTWKHRCWAGSCSSMFELDISHLIKVRMFEEWNHIDAWENRTNYWVLVIVSVLATRLLY